MIKAIKLVHGSLWSTAGEETESRQELKALELVKTIRHPYILSIDRYDVIDGRLVIVMELADRTLGQRFAECRAEGLPGIPRDELLRYMEEACEALDVMNFDYHLQHRDIKPQNLFLIAGHVKVADFGLVQELEGLRPNISGGITPAFAAPETFEGSVSSTSDQYSLAIVYQVMLTGRMPFRGGNARQILIQHLRDTPDLDALPPGDRAVIARALAKNPNDRFPSCTEMLDALREATPAGPAAAAVVGDGRHQPEAGLAFPDTCAGNVGDGRIMPKTLPNGIKGSQTLPAPLAPSGSGAAEPDAAPSRSADSGAVRPVAPNERSRQDSGVWNSSRSWRGSGPAADRFVTGHVAPPTPGQLIRELVHQHTPKEIESLEYNGLRCRRDKHEALEHRCAAWLPGDVALQKLEGFLEVRRAEVVKATPALIVLRVPNQTGFWGWLDGSPRSLLLTIRMIRRSGVRSRLTEVAIRLECEGGRPSKARQILEAIGPDILVSLRSYLLAPAEARAHERVPFRQTVSFAPTGDPGDARRRVECTARNISLGGIGFHSPVRPTSADVYLFFKVQLRDDLEPVEIPVMANVRQVTPDIAGGFLVGAHFVFGRESGTRRVMLLAGDQAYARRLTILLGQATDHPLEVESVEQIATALDRLGSGDAEAVLIDLTTDGRHRFETLKEVRLGTPRVPIVVLVDPEQTGLTHDAMEAGAAACVTPQMVENGGLARVLHQEIDRRNAEQDISLESERKRVMAELEESRRKERFLAYHDTLTGLPNRTLFYDRLKQTVARPRPADELTGVLFLDLDGFKRVNDTLGHGAGDQLLCVVAERLRGCVRERDTVARLGGDEFTVILNGLSRKPDAAAVADKILKTLAQPMEIDGHELFVTTSIGLSFYPADGQDMDAVVKKADMAMYKAKSQGKNACQMFHPSMEADESRNLISENGLRKALARDELVVYYQPQVNIESRRVVGVEALVRWIHPERGMVSPGEFIPLAEESGLIIDLGEQVLRKSCQQAAAWEADGLPPIRVCVNLSARQFRNKNLTEVVSRTLQETGLSPSRLWLEITESSAMREIEHAITTLHALRKLGVKVLIDDFGTGHSSLSYLKQLPIDGLKIEGSFVKGLPDDPGDHAIVSAVVGLAHRLNLLVIAEHVECDDQLVCLRDMKCDEVQSYLFGRPVPAESLAVMLRETPKPEAGPAHAAPAAPPAPETVAGFAAPDHPTHFGETEPSA